MVNLSSLRQTRIIFLSLHLAIAKSSCALTHFTVTTIPCNGLNHTLLNNAIWLLSPAPTHYSTTGSYALWDPWGVFFIYLTYEIGISDYKGINLGWMNLGWIFIYLFLSKKKDDISRYVFHMFAGWEFTAKNSWILRQVFHMFAGCEFMAKNGWILKHVFHMFAECEFTAKSGWIWGMFFICLQVVNLWQRMCYDFRRLDNRRQSKDQEFSSMSCSRMQVC